MAYPPNVPHYFCVKKHIKNVQTGVFPMLMLAVHKSTPIGSSRTHSTHGAAE